MNKKEIYYLLAGILSLRAKPETAKDVAAKLPREKIDWQQWVYWGSKNLVLQSLYISLKNNQLITYLPADLVDYLEEVHRLNFERNQKIIQQAKTIQNTFISKGIECVFMKGVGNIVDGLYHDFGERMVYDIDILVEEEKLLNAAQALIDAGYHTQKSFNSKAYPSTMHYPILLREDYVAGVELHRLPVQYHYVKCFSSQKVFETRRKSANEPELWVMSDSNRMIHNFLHSQLMHNGHYHADISFRDLYDFLLLSSKQDTLKVFDEFGYFRKKSWAYMQLMHRVFDIPLPVSAKTKRGGSWFLARHNFTLKLNRKQLSVYHLIINSFIKYMALPIRTIFDSNARNYVFSRLGNRHWYKQHFDAYRRKFSRREPLG
jgi:hypothetical protein